MYELSSLGKLKEGIFTHHITVFISKLQVFHITQDLFINLRPRLSRGRSMSMLSMVRVSGMPLGVSPMAQVRHVVHGAAIAMRMVAVSAVSHTRCWAVGIVIHRGLAGLAGSAGAKSLSRAAKPAEDEEFS